MFSQRFVDLALLNMQIPVVTLVARPHLKLFHYMVGLGAAVLILLQVLTLALIFKRRLFSTRPISLPLP